MSSLRITGFDHLVLRCADVEKTLAFYVDALGLAPVRVDEWRRGTVPFPSVRVSAETIIDLIPGAGIVTERNVDHFCLVADRATVDAIAADTETFRMTGERGVRFGAGRRLVGVRPRSRRQRRRDPELRRVTGYRWVDNAADVDWEELSELYRVAPLGVKPPAALATVFGNSMFVRFVYSADGVVGAGRALADGVDCAYIADIAVHPGHQGRGLGRGIIERLVTAAKGHKKIILYANPGAEGFYANLGFLPMNTAMAIWHDPTAAIDSGILRTP